MRLLKKYFLLFLTINCNIVFAQNKNILFEKTHVYLGEVDISKIVTVEFFFENKSQKSFELSYEPVTNLVNAVFPKKIIEPNAKSSVFVNFYPEVEGEFKEILKIKLNGVDEAELSISGYVVTVNKEVSSYNNDKSLFGDKDITFMLVDSKTLKGVPYSKIYIQNIANTKSYIGQSDNYGVITNRIPDGKYLIEALVDEYKKAIIGIRIDPNRNIAMILLEKEDPKIAIDKIPKLEIKKNDPKMEVTELNSSPASNTESEIDIPKLPSPKIDSNIRKNLNIILLIDISKSMENPNRMGLLKKCMINLVNNYESADQLAILTFNDKVSTLYERQKIQDKKSLSNTINSILPSGTTDGVLGIDSAFEILEKNYQNNAINMVILATDGKISNNTYDEKKMFEKIEEMNAKGILTSVLGFSTSNYDFLKLQKISNIGGGIYINMNIDIENQESILLNEIYNTLLKIKR